MGLDFLGADAHWLCSGFNRFRVKLGKGISINLDEMGGYGGDISWKELNDDPIIFLLHHPDIDGDLDPKACAKIAPRLRELIKDWPDEDYDKEQGLLLAKGMEECAKANKTLKFC